MKLPGLLTLLVSTLAAISLPQAVCEEFDLGFKHVRGSKRVGSNTYHYLHSKPACQAHNGTIVLLHGYPDLSYGWRYQIPYLTSLGYQVIAPDMLGYGRSSAPLDIRKFSMQSMSKDLVDLVGQIAPGEKVILGGHDWGGYMIYRVALWHPEFVKGIFSVCTPYFPPVTTFLDLAARIKLGITPTFGYQLQLRNPLTDLKLIGPSRIRQMLRALFGGRTPTGSLGFSSYTGLDFKALPSLGPSPFLTPDMENYYVKEYLKNGVRGPLSWYRTDAINFLEELPLAFSGNLNFSMPGLFIGATQDTALPIAMSDGMEKYFTKGLTRGEVVSSHWALWQAAKDVNKIVGEWAAKLN